MVEITELWITWSNHHSRQEDTGETEEGRYRGETGERNSGRETGKRRGSRQERNSERETGEIGERDRGERQEREGGRHEGGFFCLLGFNASATARVISRR